MTTREFLNLVAQYSVDCKDEDLPEGISRDAISDFAVDAIAKLDAKNAKRSSADTKEKKEAAARRAAILAFFQESPNGVFTRDDVAAALNVTPAQVTSACSGFVKEGVLDKAEQKVDKLRKTVYFLKKN